MWATRLLRDAKIRYMLVGATARDLLLYHVFGHPVTRATYDLDFAILVDSWEQFAIQLSRSVKVSSITLWYGENTGHRQSWYDEHRPEVEGASCSICCKKINL